MRKHDLFELDGPNGPADSPSARSAASEDRAAHAGIAYRRFPGARAHHLGRREDGRLPMLVIDGKEISWEQFGRMVMGFEGWQFRMEIKDRSEEI